MTICKNMIERSPLPMAATEGRTYNVRYVSAAFCAVVGKAKQDLVGRPIAEAVPEFSNSRVIALLDSVYSGNISGTVDILSYSDSERNVACQSFAAWAIPWSSDLANGLVIHIADCKDGNSEDRHDKLESDQNRQIIEQLLISGVKQHELAATAAKAERQLSELVQGVNAIVCEVDALTGRFTFVSERAQSFLGYRLERWNEPDFWKQIIRADYYEAAILGFQVAAHEGRDHQHEFPVTSADGAAIWLRNIAHVVRDTHGTIVKLRIVVINVTEQQNALELILQAFNRERAIAQALQYFVLLEEPEDKFDGFSVSTIYESALEESLVGGDFFDAFSLPSGRVMLVIGDVTGKGLKAAARTVEVKYALRAYARDHESPADAASHLNGYICDRNPVEPMGDSRFIALAAVVVNAADGVAQFVSAGAEPPFIVRASGSIEDINTEGMMLGVAHDSAYALVTRKLEAGDIVVLTTDGITEARRGLNFFGRDRIGSIVQNSDRSMSLHNIGVAIVDAAREHAGGKFQDDVCILLLRRK